MNQKLMYRIDIEILHLGIALDKSAIQINYQLFLFLYIYILNVIIYDKAVFLVAVHFSMQNIELSYDLGRILGHPFITVLCVHTFAYYLHDVKHGKAATRPFQDFC